MNFVKLLNEWLKYMEAQVKPSTYSCYLRLAKKHIEPYFSGMSAENINQTVISTFITEKLEKGRSDGRGGLSEKTVKDIMSVVNSVCKYGDTVYNVKRQPLLKWHYSNISKPVQIFTVEEQKVLENYLILDITPQKLGILICLYTGMRLGEICALTWNNVDVERKVFHIEKTVQRIYAKDMLGTHIFIGSPKTQSAIRDIPIASRLLPYLFSHKSQAEPAACVIDSQARIFLDPRSYQLHYKSLLHQCGLPYRNFHTLRHTFATRCVEMDMDVKSLSEILGHSNVNITLNRYVHSSIELKRNQIEKLCQIGNAVL